MQYIGADFVWQFPVTRAGVDGPLDTLSLFNQVNQFVSHVEMST